MRVDKGYSVHYISNLGYSVQVHNSHRGPELNDNLISAIILADAKEDVWLLPITNEPGAKNPDALVNGEIWEFKTNHVGTSSSIHNGIKRASHQADNVLLRLTLLGYIPDLENAIYDRIRQCSNLLKLRIIYAGRLYEFTRAAIISQAFRGTIQKEKGA